MIQVSERKGRLTFRDFWSFSGSCITKLRIAGTVTRGYPLVSFFCIFMLVSLIFFSPIRAYISVTNVSLKDENQMRQILPERCISLRILLEDLKGEIQNMTFISDRLKITITSSKALLGLSAILQLH